MRSAMKSTLIIPTMAGAACRSMPKTYQKLLCEAYTRIKQADPHCRFSRVGAHRSGAGDLGRCQRAITTGIMSLPG